MRLQQLEIKGFKSFANETVINFNEDVIGIVGPNGSGKSNIVDAIRWVLGEQKSRELRLDQMSSVIFNGSKKRKQSGLASVSLTFENTKNLLPTEYNSVTITRMLYRSGDSEYRLNGVSCRLKDITSLFLDTGIGSNSYAIIALGMVDDILADKDNSRRRMFEQAAGVAKYKVRKRETLNRLKSTSADLDRVEDLLFEINQNLVSLEKQAKRAKRYFEIKADYKTLSVELTYRRVKELRQRQENLRTQLTQEEDKYRQTQVEIDQLEAQLELERKNNLDKEKALNERQRDLNALIGKIREQESEKQMQQQRLQFIEQNREKLSRDISRDKDRLSQLSEQIELYREDLQAEKRVEARLELELTDAETVLAQVRDSHADIKADLDQVMQQQQAAERQVFELEKQRAINLNQIENYRNQLSRNAMDVDLRQREMKELQDRLGQIEAKEKAQQTQVDSLEKSEQKRQEEIQQLEKAVDKLQQEIARVNRGLDAKRNEFKLTQSMIENLEGFPESIRFLSKNKDWMPNAPLLSDIMYVKEEYRIAIENYLEPYLNYYVVAHLEEAYQAIQLLGRSQKGKANFFLLDQFADYHTAAQLLPAGMTAAVELVQVDAQYRPLVNYLLENVLIAQGDDLRAGLPAGDWNVLAQNGRYIRRRFSVSGGSVGLFEGKKIGRKKNLEILDKTIQKTERTEQKLSSQLYQERNRLQQLKQERSDKLIQQARQALSQLSQQRVGLQTRLENFAGFLSDISEKDQQLQQQIREREDANATMEQKLAEEQDAIASVKEQLTNTDGSFRAVAERLSAASTAFNNKNIDFIRQQNKVNALQQEVTFRERQLTETKAAVEANEKTFAHSAEEILVIQDRVQQMEVSMETAYAERRAKQEGLSEFEQNYFQARGGINEIEDKLRKLNRIRQDGQILINQLKEKHSDLKFELTSLGQRLQIEFNVAIEELLQNEELQPEISKYGSEELQIKVERLKSRIDNYGEINPMAVEAYNEMSERHATITKQRDDILAAKDSLLQTIKEIEETATEQFLEAFHKARLYFIDVFRSLFTEDDNCDLILLDPDDPLESKIEIVAKPKGKRPQTISQLSGGEKTLTAIALLFALYLLKPAPFCIFDEVDAPLDDANITKFNKIIKKFSKESQFIIVTHNKLTMAAVDVIYGVHMADLGISAVTPVDFRTFKESGVFESVNN